MYATHDEKINHLNAVVQKSLKMVEELSKQISDALFIQTHFYSRTEESDPKEGSDPKVLDALRRVFDAYAELVVIPLIHPLLRYITQHKEFKILRIEIYLDHSDLSKLPNASKGERGDFTPKPSTSPDTPTIRIAGGVPTADMRGTIAHELTHYAMFLLFNNQIAPYPPLDTLQHSAKIFFPYIKDTLDEIRLAAISKFKYDWANVNQIVKIALGLTKRLVEKDDNNFYILALGELIVRVPHLLSQYTQNDTKRGSSYGEHILWNQFPDLFEFYVNYIYYPLSHNPNIETLEDFIWALIQSHVPGLDPDVDLSKITLDEALKEIQNQIFSTSLRSGKSNSKSVYDDSDYVDVFKIVVDTHSDSENEGSPTNDQTGHSSSTPIQDHFGKGKYTKDSSKNNNSPNP
jgi:hypothetical protein